MRLSSSRVYRRSLQAVAVVSAAALVTAACSDSGGDGSQDSSSTTTSSTTASAAPHTVNTEMGSVEVPAGPKRVVVLGYRLTGLAFNLGAHVKGTIPEMAGGSSDASQAWSDASASEGTTFLPWFPDGFDIAGIKALDPDLIIGGGPGLEHEHAVQAYPELEQIAPTVVIGEDETSWKDQAEIMADALGAKKKLAKMTKNYDEFVSSIRENINAPEGDVGYLVFDAEGRPYAANENIGLPAELTDIGLEPAKYSQMPGLEPAGASGELLAVPPERVEEVFDQDNLFVLGYGRDVVNPGELSRDPQYADLPAIKNFRAFGLDYWSLSPGYDEIMKTLGTMQLLFAK
ncbi:ABC transporter substrate-binding protein [Dietzia timorensis]|uniref:Ferrienterobactin-binding periplasmic protein n=1 Tax=Dietzia timorensis TaxID=499555 RepID=A0A173LMN9_9ACTN|nr:ABC transporter substrate-binding protein [Dietzia timorensis]ANI92899.1 Ferrienterobactin-binding periplasmic protein [Dietzia timorensis]